MAKIDKQPEDDLSFLSVPNCSRCLEPMEPVLSAWWCQSCETALTVADVNPSRTGE